MKKPVAALLLVLLAAALSSCSAKKEERPANGYLGLDTPEVRESVDRTQSKIDEYVSTHYMDADGNIHLKTAEPTATPVTYQVEFTLSIDEK